jgi:hypothetical protein
MPRIASQAVLTGAALCGVEDGPADRIEADTLVAVRALLSLVEDGCEESVSRVTHAKHSADVLSVAWNTLLRSSAFQTSSRDQGNCERWIGQLGLFCDEMP